ncbi:MAG: hypothetical protein SPL28_02240, partial [Bacteroidales bacterium]|nr:hypothetical protein [Bacteroidales bacterium]
MEDCNQQIEHLPIEQEILSLSRPSRKSWIVFLIFFIIFLCAFFAFKAGAQSLTFADRNIERRALLKGDTDGDGHISRVEADSVKSLILTQYRTDMFEVSTYEDLALFPNLEKLWLGESKLDTVDLSKNWNLK